MKPPKKPKAIMAWAVMNKTPKYDGSIAILAYPQYLIFENEKVANAHAKFYGENTRFSQYKVIRVKIMAVS